MSGRVVVVAKRSVGRPLVEAFEAVGPDVHVAGIAARGRRRGRDLLRHRWSESVSAVRAARGASALVVVNAGSEVFLIASLLRVWPGARRVRLVVADFLPPPRRSWAWAQRVVLRRVDAWVCIRRGDIEMMARRFGVARARCSFARWPLSFDPDDVDAVSETRAEGDYVYSSGKAFRDWATVFDALELEPRPAVLGCDESTAPDIAGRAAPPFAALMGPLAPEHGRALARGAVLVIVALQDTDLASGPTVLSDALALGSAVVATDTNGTRDYLVEGSTGRLVPPGDARALADVVVELWDDPDQRARLGRAARDWTTQHLRPEDFVVHVLERCRP